MIELDALRAGANDRESAMPMHRAPGVPDGLAARSAASSAGAAPAAADDAEPLPPPGPWQTAISILQAPRYPAGFAHFNYVNPDAPKGGTVRLSGVEPDLRHAEPDPAQGRAGGRARAHLRDAVHAGAATNTTSAATYPQIADAVRFPADYLLRHLPHQPEGQVARRRADHRRRRGVVVRQAVELNESQANYYRHVMKAEKTAPDQVTFTFDEAGQPRTARRSSARCSVLPQHWWEGKDANGKQRDIGESTLEPPLGSGPYKVKEVIPGRSITYERVPDFWGKDLNTYIGTNNFDTVRYEYFRDLNVEFEAFKADQFDYWAENEAKRWDTAYDFPAIKDGQVKKETVDLDQVSGVMVGFVPNLRRPLFQDVRVRRALNSSSTSRN